MKSRIEIKRICAWCGKEFIAYKTTTNCCSHKCGNAIEKIKDKPFLTITETAIYLGVTRPTIYGYLKRGDLKATRIGTKFLLSKDDINNMFNILQILSCHLRKNKQSQNFILQLKL